MKVMAKEYRVTISYVLLSLAVVLSFVRMEFIAQDAVRESCLASEEAKDAVVAIVHALAATSANPDDPDLIARRDFIVGKIDRQDCG